MEMYNCRERASQHPLDGFDIAAVYALVHDRREYSTTEKIAVLYEVAPLLFDLCMKNLSQGIDICHEVARRMKLPTSTIMREVTDAEFR